MTSRERMLTAIRNDTPDRVPTFLCYHGLFVHRHATLQYLIEYQRRMDGAPEYPIDPAEDLEIRRQAIDLVLDLFIGRIDHGFPFPTVREFEADVMTPQLIAVALQYLETDQHKIVAEGANVRLEGDTAGVSAGSRGLETEADVDRHFDPPASAPVPSEPAGPDPYADLKAKHAAGTAESFRCGAVNSPFCISVGAFGYEGAMLAMHDRPLVFAHFVERALDRYISQVRISNADGFWFDEYYTDVISPQQYEEYVWKPNVRLAKALRESGKASTYYFCGDIVPKLERVCALDVDAIAFEESKKWFHLDIADIAPIVAGRKALYGNIDGMRLMPKGSPEDIGAEVARQMEVGAQWGGFVMGAGSPIAPDTPIVNMRALLDAVDEFGAR